MKTIREKRVLKFATPLVIAGALFLAGCGGSDAPQAPAPVVELTPAQKAVNAARAAVGGITAASTREQVEAAGEAIATAREEIGKLAFAERAAPTETVDELAARLAHDHRLAAIDAIAEVVRLAGMEPVNISGLEAAIMIAEDAIAEVPDAHQAAYTAQLSDSEATLDMEIAARAAMELAERRTLQMAELESASTSLQDALTALAGATPTQAQLDAANTALAALRTALERAVDLDATETATYRSQEGNAVDPIAMAQDRFNVAEQRRLAEEEQRRIQSVVAGVRMHIDSAEEAVAGLTGSSTDDDVEAAKALIATAKMSIDEAQIPEADKSTLRADLAKQEGALDAKKTVIASHRDAEDRQRIAGIVETLEGHVTAAETAVNGLTNSSSDADVDAAEAAITTAKDAIDAAEDIPEADKSTLRAALDVLEGVLGAKKTARTNAQDEATRIADVETRLKAKITAANALVDGLSDDSSDEAVQAAQKAVSDAEEAIDDANLPDANKAALTAMLKKTELGQKVASRDKAMKDLADAMRKAGKDLYAALAGPTAANTALNNAVVTWPAAGLTVNAAVDAGTFTGSTDPDGATGVILKAGDSVDPLGTWKGMDYAHTNADTKVVNEARVYNNKGPGKRVTFAEAGYTVATADTATDVKGYLTLDATSATTLALIEAPAFTHSATQTHQQADRADAVYVRGTYDGAPGEYRCSGDAACTSTNDGEGSPSALTGTWHFKPDTGAMVMQPDAHYLYYGWWVSKDKDGKPTAASAFTGRFGTETTDSTDGLDPGWTGTSTLTGSATYSGKAAGKFAMNPLNPLDESGNGGHFTADAELNATFSSADEGDVGVTGTIDNFRLNDGAEDAGWSVALHRAGFGSGGAISAPADDSATTDVDESMGTTWSIDGTAAARSGTWSGMMYDEMPGVPPAGDGSTIPTTATGTFTSEFSDVGRMVGAFGTDKE